MYRIPILLAFLLTNAVLAQTAAPDSPQTQETATTEGTLTTSPPDVTAEDRGFLSYIDSNGNWNDTGHMFSTGFSLGYQFSRHLSVDAYIPFYSVSASTTTTDSSGATQTTQTNDSGIGDPSFALLLRFPNQILDFRTRLTTSVPVADVQSGFSTGSVLVDWTSQFSRPIGRLLPYGQVGIANTVPDTPLFLLPYAAEGLNTRFEGGSHVLLTKILSAGASFYYVLPSGNQTLYSREYHGSNAGQGGTGTGSGGSGGSGSGQGGSNAGGGDNGNGGGIGAWSGRTSSSAIGSENAYGSGGSSGNRFGYMTQQITEGNDITRDHGFSTWLTANLPYFTDVQFGFSRSVDYDLSTFSFEVGFDPIRAFRHRQK